MAEKSEKYFKEYLSKITDDQLIDFYEGLEWTPFPVLVLKEYQNRFKSKNKKEVLKKLKMHSEITKEKIKILQAIAKKSSKATKNIKTKGKEISGYLGETINPSSEKNLEILEKLGDLKKKELLQRKNLTKKRRNC